jgi:uncharacterized protein (DUF433 family)
VNRLARGQIKSNRRGSSHSGRHTARRAVCAEIMRRIVAGMGIGRAAFVSGEACAKIAPEAREMKDDQLLERITLNPKIMAGKPVIKGTRLTVEYILNLLAHGSTTEEILGEYEGLTREDIQACFSYASGE